MFKEPTNADRAEWAAAAADAYGIASEGRADYDAPEAIAGDCIASLLHLIRAHGGDPMQALETARMNFEAEEEEEEVAV